MNGLSLNDFRRAANSAYWIDKSQNTVCISNGVTVVTHLQRRLREQPLPANAGIPETGGTVRNLTDEERSFMDSDSFVDGIWGRRTSARLWMALRNTDVAQQVLSNLVELSNNRGSISVDTLRAAIAFAYLAGGPNNRSFGDAYGAVELRASAIAPQIQPATVVVPPPFRSRAPGAVNAESASCRDWASVRDNPTQFLPAPAVRERLDGGEGSGERPQRSERERGSSWWTWAIIAGIGAGAAYILSRE